MKIVQEGALVPLVKLLSADDVEILREVLACLSNLAISDENKLEIVKAGVTPSLIALSQSADMIVASQASAALATLAEIGANQDIIANEGAIKPAVIAMRSKFIEVQRESGRLLANLCASDSEFTDRIIECGGHNLLISYLLSQDTYCQRVGALGICNLCTQPRFRKLLLDCGVLEPLCSLARSEDVEMEIQRFSVLAVANLASAPENHHTFIQDGILSLLVSLSTTEDPEVRQFAAYAVVKIARNAAVRDVVTEEGGLEPVLYLARTDEPAIQDEGMCVLSFLQNIRLMCLFLLVIPALCSLSFADANKYSICRNGGLPAILQGITHHTTSLAALACCTIANLSEMAENMDLIVDGQAIPRLVGMLKNPSEELKKEAARALGNLSSNIEYGDMILREGPMPYLIAMLRSTDSSCQRMGAMSISNLTSNTRNQTFILEAGLFDPLLSEAKLALDPKSSSDIECCRYCLLTMANLAVNVGNHPMLLQYALPTLAAFSKHNDMRSRQHAVFCIANLCSNLDNIEAIVSSGCLRTIITYAFPTTDSNSNVQFQAVSALRGLAVHPIIRLQLVREGALEPLIMAAGSESIEIQREAAAALCNLALAEDNKVIMARGGVLPALISLALSGDSKRETLAVAALANIAEMIEGRTQDRMIEEGVIRPVLR